MRKLFLIIFFNVFLLNASENDAIIIPKSIQKVGLTKGDFIVCTNPPTILVDDRPGYLELIKKVIEEIIEENNVEEFENLLKFFCPAIGSVTSYFIMDALKNKLKIILLNNKILELILKYKLIDQLIISMRHNTRLYFLNQNRTGGNCCNYSEELTRLKEFQQLYSSYLEYKKQYEDEFLTECKKHVQYIPGLSGFVCSYHEFTFEEYLEINPEKKVGNSNPCFSGSSSSNFNNNLV